MVKVFNVVAFCFLLPTEDLKHSRNGNDNSSGSNDGPQ